MLIIAWSLKDCNLFVPTGLLGRYQPVWKIAITGRNVNALPYTFNSKKVIYPDAFNVTRLNLKSQFQNEIKAR